MFERVFSGTSVSFCDKDHDKKLKRGFVESTIGSLAALLLAPGTARIIKRTFFKLA